MTILDDRLELPSKEDINCVTSLDELRQWESYIERVATKIEVDLSVLADGDDDWHSRARSALAYHRMTLSWVRARIRRLTKGNLDHVDQYVQAATAKAAKKEAQAKAREAHNQSQALAAQNKVIQAKQRQVDFLQRTSYLLSFKKATYRTVPPEQLESILALAETMHMATMKREIGESAE